MKFLWDRATLREELQATSLMLADRPHDEKLLNRHMKLQAQLALSPAEIEYTTPRNAVTGY